MIRWRGLTVTRHRQELLVRCRTFSSAKEHRQTVANVSRQANLLFVEMPNEQLTQSAKTTDQYRPLDVSRSEIRLLSFENTAHGSIRLNILYASLNDRKPDYVSFHDKNSSTMSSSQLSEAWGDRLATTKA